MVKNTIVALVAAASLAGIAVPAFAAPAPTANEVNTEFDDGLPGARVFTGDLILVQLQQKGINATEVEDWSGLIRAYVTLEDGSQAMQFFTPGTLEQVLL